MEENKDIYRQLQEHLHSLPVGFPRAESGADIRILQEVFTPDEAELAIELGPLPESLDRIYKRVKKKGISRDELEKRLDAMEKKGLIFGPVFYHREKGKKYTNAMYVIGMMEAQVNRMTKSMADNIETYTPDFSYEYFRKESPNQMRIIPVGISVSQESCIVSYDDIRKIITDIEEPISAMNCLCRHRHDILGEPCKKTHLREMCMSFSDGARHFLNSGVGRAITRSEAMALVDEFEKAGLVLQPTNYSGPLGLCACCSCCCDALAMAKQLPDPANYYRSNYYAASDRDVCTGCATCVDSCQMDAVAIEDGTSHVNLNRCIGCGLCTASCTTGAMTLRRKEKVTVPPNDLNSLYQKILLKKIGVGGMVKVAVKSILGMKV